jgi:2-oxoglutarate ferredoxin oxidoreductase subunit alpha
MHNILQTEMPEMATKLLSLAHLDGMPLTARWVVDAIGDGAITAGEEGKNG